MPAVAEHLSVPLLSRAEQLETLQPNLELGLQDMTGTEEGVGGGTNTGGCSVNTIQGCTISFSQCIQGQAGPFRYAYLLEGSHHNYKL